MGKRSKAELIDFILQTACANRPVRQAVQSEYELEVSNRDLIADTRRAIQVATDFDDRDINSNFDYDFDAYRAIERNFARLISKGKLAEVMELSVQLMREGSRQVECSDEGMMTDDIELCLGVVLKALKKKCIPASDIVRWCDQMLHADRVGFIGNEELRALRKKFVQGMGDMSTGASP